MLFLERPRREGRSGRGVRSHPNVLTPDTIPEFVIPPLLGPAARRGGGALPAAAGRHLAWVEADSEGEGSALRVPRHANPAEILRLPESPHTRRKESLFHARVGDWAQSLRPRPEADALSSSSSSSPSSADSTPFGSPRAPRPAFPGSTGGGETPPALPPSADPGSQPPRGQASIWLAPPPTPLHPPRPARPPKATTVGLNKGGALRLWAEYATSGRRLRVRLVSGEGLYPASFPPGAVSCWVGVYLLPGKAQKQRSAIVRGCRDPAFNEDFFFERLGLEDLASKALRIKVVNKGSLAAQTNHNRMKRGRKEFSSKYVDRKYPLI